MNELQLKNLNKLMQAMDTSAMSQDEMVKAFQKIIDHVKKNEETMNQALVQIRSVLEGRLGNIESGNSSTLQQMKDTVNGLLDSKFSTLEKNLIKKVDDKLLTVVDGIDADEDRVVQLTTDAVLAKIPPAKELEPETPESIRDSLEALEGEERLDKSAIKGLDEELKRIDKKPKTAVGNGRSNNSTKFYSLTPDSSTKIFSVPKSVASIVLMSDFPHILFENSGFTINATRTQITLTVDNAPTTGSQLLYQYSSMFN